MKFFTLLFLSCVFSLSVFAQSPSSVLGVANGRDFTAADLDPNVRPVWENFPGQMREFRRDLLERQIVDFVLNLEALERKISPEELYKKEVAEKIPNPSAEEIKAVYEANRGAIGDKTLEEMRPQIAGFLRREPEERIWLEFVSKLKSKYAVKLEKDVNARNSRPEDVLAQIGAAKITFRDFERKNALKLYEFEANVYEQAIESLRQSIDSALILAESQAAGIPPDQFIAREIMNKMKDFTPAEEERLARELRAKLYAKYKASVFIKEPMPFIQSVSADDDPFQGKPEAPVTVVMFTDFECPACAATHPILKRVIAEYGDQVKFVVRDFPLTQIHRNAFGAAVAAGAANRQGKFFEFTELLYENQNSLDPASLKILAQKAGLDIKRFEKDLADEKLSAEIRADMSDGIVYGVGSTPSIFVNGYKIRTISAASFREAIERALR